MSKSKDMKRLIAARGHRKSIITKMQSFVSGPGQPKENPNQGQQNGKSQRLPRINIKEFNGETKGRAVALETVTHKDLQPEQKERKSVVSCAATATAVNKQKQKSVSVKQQCSENPTVPA